MNENVSLPADVSKPVFADLYVIYLDLDRGSDTLFACYGDLSSVNRYVKKHCYNYYKIKRGVLVENGTKFMVNDVTVDVFDIADKFSPKQKQEEKWLAKNPEPKFVEITGHTSYSNEMTPQDRKDVNAVNSAYKKFTDVLKEVNKRRKEDFDLIYTKWNNSKKERFG